MRSRLQVTFPRSAQARCGEAAGGAGSARAARAGAERAAAVRGEKRRQRRADTARGQRGDTGAAMYRHVTATVTAAVRLRPGRAWAPAAAAALPGRPPPRRRYRARLQDLEPPLVPGPALALLPPPRCPPRPPATPGSPPRGLQGLGGAPVTTVDGRREDDIAVRDRDGGDGGDGGDREPGRGARLLLGPPPSAGSPPEGGGGSPQRHPPSMEEHLASVHERLRHELPNFFLKIPDYGLYAPDVEFQCQHLHLHTRGRAMYALALALCRALAWGYFASLRLEVLALTRHPEDWSVRARWRLTGLPLHLLLLRWYRRDKRTLLRSYDALSTFFLNSQGLIRCHRVDKLMPAPTAVPEPKKLLVAAALAVALARP
ncbi:LOW QUALITY PROTEIN: uncharacterized protein C6orf136 homolog [Melozone crissalis]|uniref:LOW QUALITY PROTEIN: uncharacterized protein C6orf136 homolog n=1 Tax=Melozone crissalis TaxID=40204 RepID=UPI0023DC7322|nr:LOW QUALITY PROTEIN: uncharacterized protein C6orf136 homolog [Melozone crissalis]